jgi:hypothetical protein
MALHDLAPPRVTNLRELCRTFTGDSAQLSLARVTW